MLEVGREATQIHTQKNQRLQIDKITKNPPNIPFPIFSFCFAPTIQRNSQSCTLDVFFFRIATRSISFSPHSLSASLPRSLSASLSLSLSVSTHNLVVPCLRTSPCAQPRPRCLRVPATEPLSPSPSLRAAVPESPAGRPRLVYILVFL